MFTPLMFTYKINYTFFSEKLQVIYLSFPFILKYIIYSIWFYNVKEFFENFQNIFIINIYTKIDKFYLVINFQSIQFYLRTYGFNIYIYIYIMKNINYIYFKVKLMFKMLIYYALL